MPRIDALDHDGGRAVGSEVQLLDDDLAADVGRGHRGRSGVGMARQGSGSALALGPCRIHAGRDRIGSSSPPEVAAALADGGPVVALESTLISHGLPYPQNLEVAPRVRGGGPRRRGGAGDGRGPRRATARGLAAADLEALATAPAGSRPQGGPAVAGGGPGRGRLGGDDRVGDDDRGVRGGDPGRSPRAASVASIAGRWAAARRPVDLRHLVRSPGARADADGRRVRRTQGHPRRAGHARVPRDPGRAGHHGRPGRAAGVLRAVVRHPFAGRSSRTWRRPPRSSGTHLALGLGSGVLVCVPVPADVALPDDAGPAPWSSRPIARGGRRRRRRSGAHAVAARPRSPTLTDGASVRANTALIVNDARVAGEIARAGSRPSTCTHRRGAGAPIRLSAPSRSLHSADRRTARPCSRTEDPTRMRIYEGSPRQDFEEVFRCIGAFLDQRGMQRHPAP